MSESSQPFDRLDYTYKLLVVIGLSIAAIVLAREIFIPMAFAALLSIVMLPLVKKMEQRKIPTSIAIAIVLLLTIVTLVLVIWIVVNQVMNLLSDLPDLQVRFENYLDQISKIARRDFNITKIEQGKIITDAMKSVSAYLGDVLITTSSTLTTLIQIPIYIFLFLIYRDKFKNFFIRLMPGKTEFLWKKDIERVVQGYISGLMLVTLIIATLNSIGLLVLGIDHAIFFGILSGLLTIIPYVGITIGATFPIIMALITKDSIWSAVGVVAVFSTVQFFEGNFISPRITGSKVSINALAAIIALVIGGKLLGIAGMILAVPGIGVLKVLLSHSPHLNPFVILLEDKNDSEPIIASVVTEEVKEESEPNNDSLTGE
ncbi:MAG TPA: AI-2E family transporter [Cyclobacteriaceae bacterium]|jgi:predicted PurR-regulated permease PerM|nr:AI-2E family transporter [Cyclobacteriaceae bacterium]